MNKFEFKKTMIGGYSVDSVHQYVDMVEMEISKLLNQLSEKLDCIDELETELEEYKSREKAISDVYVDSKQYVTMYEQQIRSELEYEKQKVLSECENQRKALQHDLKTKKLEFEMAFEEKKILAKEEFNQYVEQIDLEIHLMEKKRQRYIEMNEEIKLKMKREIYEMSQLINKDFLDEGNAHNNVVEMVQQIENDNFTDAPVEEALDEENLSYKYKLESDNVMTTDDFDYHAVNE